jgi:hypothetical protein
MMRAGVQEAAANALADARLQPRDIELLIWASALPRDYLCAAAAASVGERCMSRRTKPGFNPLQSQSNDLARVRATEE